MHRQYFSLCFFQIVKEQIKLSSQKPNAQDSFAPPGSFHPARRQALTVELFLRGPFDTAHQVSGGGERDRTDDILLAKQALSQLSYTPINAPPFNAALTRLIVGGSGWIRTNDPRLIKTVL